MMLTSNNKFTNNWSRLTIHISMSSSGVSEDADLLLWKYFPQAAHKPATSSNISTNEMTDIPIHNPRWPPIFPMRSSS